ncbi:GNAT family N-acetyltransferase [Actinomycetes bacterium NPDC127524]
MLHSEKIYLRPFTEADAGALLNLFVKNKSFFEPFSSERKEDYYTLEFQKKAINSRQQYSKEDKAYHFGIFLAENNTLIGNIDLFQVIRGSLQSAFIGYSLDKDHNGKGYTTIAAKLVVHYAFTELQLHRIEAGVMPHNIGSIRVLEKAGFHKEGIAIKNVKINGNWEDHQVLAIINPND